MLDRIRPVWWFSGIVLLSLIFGLIQFQQSLRQGLLAFPPTYDNNGYLVETIRYVDSLFKDGLWSLLSGLVSAPPHAPISEAISLLGFALFGVQDWAPNLIQSVEPVALLLIVNRLGQRCGRMVRLAVMLAVLATPVTRFIVQELRPDILWGFLLAGGMALMLSTEAVQGDRATLRFAGVLIGLGVLAKPTILPLNVALVGGSMLILASIRFALRRPNPLSLRDWQPLLGPALLIPAPYFIVAWRTVAEYIYMVLFAPRADEWLLSKPGPFWTEAQYYLTGPGGTTMLGGWIWVFAGLGTTAAAVAVVRRDTTGIVIGIGNLSALALNYMAITIPRLKSDFFGTSFAYLVIFLASKCLFYLVNHSRASTSRTARGVLVTAVCAWACFSFHFVSEMGQSWPTSAPARDGQRWYRALDDIFHTLSASGVSQGEVFVTNVYYYLTPTTLTYLSLKDEANGLVFSEAVRSRVMAEYATLLDQASAVVDVRNMDGRDDITPRAARDLIADRLRTDRSLKLASRIDVGGETIASVYVRRAPFEGFKALSGFGAEEVRLIEPQADDHAQDAREDQRPRQKLVRPRKRVFHWGIGPRTVLQVDFPPSGHLTVSAVAEQPGHDVEPVAVSVDGKPEGDLVFGAGQPAPASLVLSGAPGPATVTMDYRSWLPPAGAETRSLAVLFDGLRFEAAP